MLNNAKKEVIDNLAEWLYKDIERDLRKQADTTGCPLTHYTASYTMLRDILERIKWYRDNEVL